MKCPKCGHEFEDPEEATPEEAKRIIATWNEFAGPLKLPKSRPSNKKVVNQIRTRLKTKGYEEDLALAMSYILSKDFYRGNNSTGWKANLEWLTKSGKAEELAEQQRVYGQKGGRQDAEAGRFSARKRAD